MLQGYRACVYGIRTREKYLSLFKPKQEENLFEFNGSRDCF